MPASNKSNKNECLLRMQRLVVHRGHSLACVAAFVFCFAASQLFAQDKNPFAGDAKVAKLGESQFRANCAFCHGLGARGGGRGPDLTRAQKRHGNADADLFRTINEGVPGTAMPPNGATQQGVGMTEARDLAGHHLHPQRASKSPAQIAGDARTRKGSFFSATAGCCTCHMIQGKGGRLGPDLTTTGSARSTDYLIESAAQPEPPPSAGNFRSHEGIFPGVRNGERRNR